MFAGKKIFSQGAGAGCLWPLGARAAWKKIPGAGAAWEKKSGAGGAWKKSQEPEPLKNFLAPQPCQKGSTRRKKNVYTQGPITQYKI